MLDILETHLPWQQRVIQLATVQGHEQETSGEYGGGHGVTWGSWMRVRKDVLKDEEQRLKMRDVCFLCFGWAEELKKGI